VTKQIADTSGGDVRAGHGVPDVHGAGYN